MPDWGNTPYRNYEKAVVYALAVSLFSFVAVGYYNLWFFLFLLVSITWILYGVPTRPWRKVEPEQKQQTRTEKTEEDVIDVEWEYID